MPIHDDSRIPSAMQTAAYTCSLSISDRIMAFALYCALHVLRITFDLWMLLSPRLSSPQPERYSRQS